MSTFLASARIARLDTVRRPGYWIGAASFMLAAALGAVPFSAGVAADAGHYADAGISTLLLGGVFLSLMLVPGLLAGRGGEGIRALPAARGALTSGIFSGFAMVVAAYFLAGGAVLVLVHGVAHEGVRAIYLIPRIAFSFFDTLVAAAVVLLASRFLSYAPAVMASASILLLGSAAAYLPFPLSLAVPAFHHLDPLSMADLGAGFASLALLHGAAVMGLCLSLATYGLRRRLTS